MARAIILIYCRVELPVLGINNLRYNCGCAERSDQYTSNIRRERYCEINAVHLPARR